MKRRARRVAFAAMDKRVSGDLSGEDEARLALLYTVCIAHILEH